MIIIVAQCCALSLCFSFGFIKYYFSTLIFMTINTNQVISLYIYTSQIIKSGFFVARATSKTLKIFRLYNHVSPEGHLTFMNN